jgi:hypothetical protein
MRSKIKLTGESLTDLEILLEKCSNNNQICHHIKNNDYILKYMNSITGLDLPVMESFYHYKENIKEIPKCICGKNRKYHCVEKYLMENMVWNENCIIFATILNQYSMNEKTLYKTSEFVSFLKDINVNVVVDSNPDSSTIERIKKLIAKKRAA